MIDAIKICSVQGCDGRHLARGFCSKHYQRWRQYGDPLALGRKLKRELWESCSVQGCKELDYALGLCRVHYHRMRRWGDASALKKISNYNGEPCSVLGCFAKAKNRGFCELHYSRWRRSLPMSGPEEREISCDNCHIPFRSVHRDAKWCCKECRDEGRKKKNQKHSANQLILEKVARKVCLTFIDRTHLDWRNHSARRQAVRLLKKLGILDRRELIKCL